MAKDNLLKEALEILERDDEEHRRLGEAELDDKRFYAGDQWSAAERNRRRRKHLPTQTNNLLQKYVAQMEGDDLLNMTEAKVEPENSGTADEAEIREGIIRSIQNSHKAKVAFNVASRSAIICGVGNFGLSVTESSYDVFDKDINIEPIYNAHSVVWDKDSVEPTGEDADHVFQIETFDERAFEKAFGKKAQKADVYGTGFLERVTRKLYTPEQSHTIRVATWWRMSERPVTVALAKDMTTMDITDMKKEDWLPFAAIGENGEPIVRDTVQPIVERRVFSGAEWLEDVIELPISRVPIFRVCGKYEVIGEDYVRWGLVRLLKDAQVMNNYWDSAIVRLLQLSTFPQPYKVRAGAIAGYEDQWMKYWENEDGVLVYNADYQAPEREDPMTINPALFAERERAAQYLADISNMNEASLGASGNERTGRAIQARHQIAQLGMAAFSFHRDLAKQACGRTINELIPYVYDTNRVVSIMDPNNETKLREINAVTDERSRITNAKYRVTVTTGPSYATKMQEQAEVIMTALERAPDVMSVGLDKVLEGIGLHDIAKRIRAQMPPGVIQPDEMTPEERAASEAAAKAASEKAEMERMRMQAELQKSMAEARREEAMAREAEARAQKIIAEIGISSERIGIEEMQARAAADEKLAKTAKTLSEIGVMATESDAKRLAAIGKIMNEENDAERQRNEQNSERRGEYDQEA